MARSSFLLLAAFVFVAAGARAGELPKAPVANTSDTTANQTHYYADLAAVHQKYKAYDKAEECLKKAIELEPNTTTSADYAYQLGQLYLEWGKEKEAEMMFEFSLDTTPDTGSALINRSRELGRIYENKKQFDKAEAVYKKALEKATGPVASTIERELFELAQKTGKIDDIIAQKEKQVAADPKRFQLHYDLAYLYRLKGDKKKETAAYEAVAQINPNDSQALGQLAVAYRDEGNVDKAVMYFQKLSDNNPQAKPYYITEIVKVYAKAKRQKEADTWTEKLMDDKEMATAAGRARLARLYQETEAYDKSIEQFKKAVSMAENPQQREQYDVQLARVYLKSKHYSECEALCKKLMSESKDLNMQREAKYMLVAVYGEQGREADLKKFRETQ